MKIFLTGGQYLNNTSSNRINMQQRDELGRFKRLHYEWSLDNFDDGFSVNLRGKKRFKVYKPNHPRANLMGHMLRSIVAYEAYHDIEVPLNMEIHHKDGNTLNDNKENLVLLSNSEHQRIHAIERGSLIKHICEHCGKPFYIQKYRLKDLSSGIKKRGRFCSQKCYHEHPRTEEHNKNISKGLFKKHRERKH